MFQVWNTVCGPYRAIYIHNYTRVSKNLFKFHMHITNLAWLYSGLLNFLSNYFFLYKQFVLGLCINQAVEAPMFSILVYYYEVTLLKWLMWIESHGHSHNILVTQNRWFIIGHSAGTVPQLPFSVLPTIPYSSPSLISPTT